MRVQHLLPIASVLNKQFWGGIGNQYSKLWRRTKGAKYLSKKEQDFIGYYLNLFPRKNVLDIGTGSGRILEGLIKNSLPNALIGGIDISPKMIAVCRKKFAKVKKICFLKEFDISKKEIKTLGIFDFITAVRVLKYCPNWKEILGQIYKALNKGGIFIFTMPNKFSINYFFKGPLPREKTTFGELKKTLNGIGYKILEIRSLSKIPGIFYSSRLSDKTIYLKLLAAAEKTLELLLGKVFLGRGLFIVAQK